jgi:hypothetical protein
MATARNNQPNLRLIDFDPPLFQCTNCTTQYYGGEGYFKATKLLALAFLKHIVE